MPFPRYFPLALVTAARTSSLLLAGPQDEPPHVHLIGHTELRTNLPGRHANQTTMRAVVVKADGTGRRVLAEELTREKHSWNSFDLALFSALMAFVLDTFVTLLQGEGGE